ncbi:MAG: hypothetical protein K0S08_1910 [Gammaproteobacteria bacterium]|jgi:hypothetical protein|nr:hypothetical protein [Gammaproteobacteria bacterium]
MATKTQEIAEQICLELFNPQYSFATLETHKVIELLGDFAAKESYTSEELHVINEQVTSSFEKYSQALKKFQPAWEQAYEAEQSLQHAPRPGLG